MNMITFNTTPIGKPRMTQRDRWKKRPSVNRYYQYKDSLKEQAQQLDFEVGNRIFLVFHIPMAKSWSKKKKEQLLGKAHKQTPDTDNLLKAFCDALCEDDSHVWDKRGIKLWSDEGKIEVLINSHDTIESPTIDLTDYYEL